jgi:hypothetical protein
MGLGKTVQVRPACRWRCCRCCSCGCTAPALPSQLGQPPAPAPHQHACTPARPALTQRRAPAQTIAFIAALLGKTGTSRDADLPGPSSPGGPSGGSHSRGGGEGERGQAQAQGDAGGGGPGAGGQQQPARRWPILVVCPTSVMGNWCRELGTWGTFRWAPRRAAGRALLCLRLRLRLRSPRASWRRARMQLAARQPALQARASAGFARRVGQFYKKERMVATKEAALAGRLEVVVTSYDTMRRHIAGLQEIPFHAGGAPAAGLLAGC